MSSSHIDPQNTPEAHADGRIAQADMDDSRRSRDQAADRTYRNPVLDGHRSKFYIDPEKIPEGKIYRWAREKTASESISIDENNLMEYIEEGWEFVPASRHPELCLDALVHNRKVKDSDRIKKFGHVLMEMDLIEWRRLRAADRQASYDQMMSIQHTVPGAANAADFNMFFTKANDVNYTHAVVRDKDFQQ